jgi:hypothetical protein
LEEIRSHCKEPGDPQKISHRLFDITNKLVRLNEKIQLRAVTEVLQSRLLAVAIYSAPRISEKEREILLDQWERVTFRIFGIVHKDSRFKVGEYLRIGNRIVTEDDSVQTFDQIMIEIKSLGQDYPANTEIRKALAGADFYEYPEMCRYFLWNYEEHLASSLGKSATLDEQERAAIWKKRATDSIEHIFPQNPGDNPAWQNKMIDSTGETVDLSKNVGRIGNLILLPTSLNSEAKARPFAEKKAVYMKHNLRMIKEIGSIDDWNLSAIVQRENVLIEWATKRWADLE